MQEPGTREAAHAAKLYVLQEPGTGEATRAVGGGSGAATHAQEHAEKSSRPREAPSCPGVLAGPPTVKTEHPVIWQGEIPTKASFVGIEKAVLELRTIH